MINVFDLRKSDKIHNILFSMTKNPNSIFGKGDNSDKKDPRYEIFVYLLEKMQINPNTKVYLLDLHAHVIPQNLKKNATVFNFANDKDKIDIVISWQTIAKASIPKYYEIYSYFKNKNIPMLIYEHGPLNGSILIDRGPLSDSKYVDNLSNIVNDNYNENEYFKYRKHLLENGISKREQKNRDSISQSILKKYIFVPQQKITDFTIEQYSKIGMIDFIKKVCSFCKTNDLPLVIKLHPHTNDHEQIIDLVKKLKREYKSIYVINANIYDLCRNALFTACINSGTITDNFIVNSLVYTCGKSMFYKTDAVYFDENIDKGLMFMFGNIDNNDIFNREKIFDLQNKIIWFMHKGIKMIKFNKVI